MPFKPTDGAGVPSELGSASPTRWDSWSCLRWKGLRPSSRLRQSCHLVVKFKTCPMLDMTVAMDQIPRSDLKGFLTFFFSKGLELIWFKATSSTPLYKILTLIVKKSPESKSFQVPCIECTCIICTYYVITHFVVLPILNSALAQSLHQVFAPLFFISKGLELELEPLAKRLEAEICSKHHYLTV